MYINWVELHLQVNVMEEVPMLADILGGKVGESPTIYLGMPLGAKRKSKGSGME